MPLIKTLEQMKKLSCALPCSHPDFIPPTPEEVALLIALMGWSQREVALIAGVVQTDKGSPTVRRWKSPISSNEHRQIPNASWQYLLEFAGFESVRATKESLRKHHPFLYRDIKTD